jgi:beta-glucosidase
MDPTPRFDPAPDQTPMIPRSLKHLLAALAVASAAGAPLLGADAPRPLYLDPGQPLEARVEDLLARLTLEEKISLLHGDSKFTTAAIPRLGIPRRWLSDGPHGVREDVGPDTWLPAGHTDDFSTCMPCGIALAATWNPDLARSEGTVIGEEARARGKNIMLGPAVNIMRTPLCGRNFEYLGEDPYLTGRRRLPPASSTSPPTTRNGSGTRSTSSWTSDRCGRSTCRRSRRRCRKPACGA